MIYEYRCPRGHVTTKRGGLDDASSPCGCGLTVQRKPFNLASIRGDTVAGTYSVSEFMEATQEVDYHYAKAQADGMPVRRPDPWAIAKREARKRNPKIAAV